MRTAYAIFAVLAALAGCSVVGYERRTVNSPIELYKGEAHAYQLRIPLLVEGRGSPHSLPEYNKRQYVWADWISLNAEGEVPADAGFIRACAEGHEKPALYGKREVRGTVHVTSSSAKVALQIRAGSNPDGSPAWQDYENNGEYKIERPSHDPTNAVPTSAAECLR